MWVRVRSAAARSAASSSEAPRAATVQPAESVRRKRTVRAALVFVMPQSYAEPTHAQGVAGL
jgi:hypothetical protein